MNAFSVSAIIAFVLGTIVSIALSSCESSRKKDVKTVFEVAGTSPEGLTIKCNANSAVVDSHTYTATTKYVISTAKDSSGKKSIFVYIENKNDRAIFIWCNTEILINIKDLKKFNLNGKVLSDKAILDAGVFHEFRFDTVSIER